MSHPGAPTCFIFHVERINLKQMKQVGWYLKKSNLSSKLYSISNAKEFVAAAGSGAHDLSSVHLAAQR